MNRRKYLRSLKHFTPGEEEEVDMKIGKDLLISTDLSAQNLNLNSGEPDQVEHGNVRLPEEDPHQEEIFLIQERILNHETTLVRVKVRVEWMF